MNRIMKKCISNYQRSKKTRRRLISMLLMVSMLLTMVIAWQTPVSATGTSTQYGCGQEQHIHSEECYEQVLICNQEETDGGHKHTQECYASNMICQKEEHTHTDDCIEKNFSSNQSENSNKAENIEDLSDGKTIDFTEYITSTKIEKKNGDQWQELQGHLVVGDAVHIRIDYAIPENMIQGNSTIFSYQVPSGIQVSQKTTGTVENENQKQVGAYTISESGDIEVSFAEGFTNSSPFTGNVVFEGAIEAGQGAGSYEISFGGKGGTVQVDPVSALENLLIGSTTQDRVDPTGALNGPTLLTTGPIDFTQYLTSSEVKVKEGNTWVTLAGSLTVGDQVQVTLTYTIPADTVTAENRVICYQVPAAIQLSEATSGNVTVPNDTKVVGTYTISKTGYVQITFNNDFADSSPFNGSVMFTGAIVAIQGDQPFYIDFGGQGETVRVEPNSEHEALRVSKQASGDQLDQINYTITISSDLGTSGPITLEDEFTTKTGAQKVQYVDGSLTVKKSGQIITGYTPAIDANGPGFTLTNLPQLSAGESYVVTYQVACTPEAGKPGYDITLDNQAEASSGDDKAVAEKILHLEGTMLEKEGFYDAGTDTITWRVTVNEARQQIGGQAISDTIRAGNYTIPVESAKLTVWGVEYMVSLPLELPNGFTDTFVLEYTLEDVSKTYPSLSTVSNTVKLDMYQDQKDVEIIGTGFDIVKEAVSQKPDLSQQDKGIAAIYWESTITVPQNAEPFTYTDQMGEFQFAGHSYPAIHHFTGLSFLQATGKVKVGNQELVLGTDYRLLLDGKVPDPNAHPELWQQEFDEFQIQFTEPGMKKIRGQTVTIEYATGFWTDGVIDDAGNYVEKGMYTVKNTGIIPGHKDYAELSWEDYKGFEKQASATGPGQNDNTSSYYGENVEVSFEETGGKIYYRLLLQPDATTSGDIVVTDTLPDGTTLVENSAQLYGHVTNFQRIEIPNYLTTETDGQTITFTIDEAAYKNVSGYDRLAIYYEVSVAKDPQWNNPNKTTVTYKNTAHWQDDISISTEVVREIHKVEKSGVQQKDAQDKVTDTVSYRVVVNEDGEDLVPGADTLTLTDTLDLPGNLSAYLDLTSVKVYEYDEHKDDNLGALLRTNEYSYQYDEDTNQIEFTVPDQKGLVIVYDYKFNLQNLAGATFVNNEAELNGVAYGSDDADIQVQTVNSSATANKATLTIYKVDSENDAILLPGAKFKLERYEKQNNDTYRWTQTSLTAGEDGLYETGPNGSIVLNFLEGTTWQDNSSLYNTLYRMTEQEAPEGYELGQETYYFVWMNASATKEQTIEAMESQNIFGDGEGQVDPNQVRFIEYSTSAFLTVENTAEDNKQITVEKVWKDTAGDEITSTASLPEVTVQLYQYKGTDNSTATEYKNPVVLNEGNQWTYTWENLPGLDTDGTTPLYYYVKETSNVDGYTVTYSVNNSGVQSGTITVTNQETFSYVLPETGGKGMLPIYMLGSLLLGTGLFFAVKRKRKMSR